VKQIEYCLEYLKEDKDETNEKELRERYKKEICNLKEYH
jgi:hypothetical protein